MTSSIVVGVSGREAALYCILTLSPVGDTPQRHSGIVECRTSESPKSFTDAAIADPFASASTFAAGAEPSISSQAQRVIAWLAGEATSLRLPGLPAMDGRLLDDGSAVLEIRFPNRRLAFTIEHRFSQRAARDRLGGRRLSA